LSDSRRTGVTAGLLAYTIWGLFPLYFVLLTSVSPLEIAANRVVWSLLLVLALVTGLGRWPVLRQALRDRRTVIGCAIGGLMLTANWTIYIAAVENDAVVEGALGYYINPLVTVLFGVVLLKERLSRLQVVSLSLAAVAVVILTFDFGRPPWIALSLAATFGLYGLAKKLVDAPSLEGLGLETGAMLIPALIVMAVIGQREGSALTTSSAGTVALLVALGVITTVPLLLFGVATSRVPLTLMGLMQYATPTIQFIVGLVVLGESFPASRFVGFALVWVALAVLGYDGWRRHRSTLDPAVEPTY
jgi:chloramphenicol-sensitive protein RarD